MQKHFRSVIAATFLSAILFSSCKKDNRQGRYVPSNASFVIHFNGESISSKLSWEEIKQNDLFKKMNADTSVPAFAKSALDNPENAGLDIKSDLVIFVVKDSTGGYTGIEGSIKDRAKFKQFLIAANKNGKETTQDGNTFFSDEKASIGYNKDRFIATINTPEIDYMRNMNRAYDSTGMPVTKPLPVRNMAALSASLFALKEDAGLGKNEKFSDLMAAKGDVHFYYSAENFMTGMGGLPGMMGMGAAINFDKLTKGAVTTATINFEDGKIAVDMKSYGGKELTELFKKYEGNNLDKKMLKSFPSKNVAALFAFSFKPEGLKEFLRLLNMDGLANLGAGQMGFNLDDFVKANKGDLLFAVSELKSDSSTGMDGKYLFSASINDKASFDKIINAGKKAGGMMMRTDSGLNYHYNSNGKYFVFGNDKTMDETFLAGTSNTSFDFLDKITNGSFGGYVNFQNIMGAAKMKGRSDSLQTAMLDASMKMWDNLIISGGNFSGGALNQHWEVNLVDKKMNSLKQLNNYAASMGMMADIKRKKEEAMWTITDSTSMVLPDTTLTMIDTTKK